MATILHRIQCNGRDTDRGVLDKPTPTISIGAMCERTRTPFTVAQYSKDPFDLAKKKVLTRPTYRQSPVRKQAMQDICPYMRDKQHGRGRRFAPPTGPPNPQVQDQGCIIPSSGSCQMKQQQTHIPLRDLLQSAPFQVQKHKR